MNFAYYPGCSAKGSSLDYERSTQAVCKALGMTLTELEGWNCCGSTPAHATSHALSAALCARNLNLAAKAGHKLVVTPCPSCLSNHLAARERMEEAAFRAEVEELIDEPVAETLPNAISVLQAIEQSVPLETLTQKTVASLEGLTVAAYYGCLMSRPPKRMQFEDPEHPMLMERMLAACGAKVVDFPLKTACCGAAFGIPHRPLTQVNSGRILKLACDMGVDCLIVCCPLCQMNLDLRQAQVEAHLETRFRLPILYYTQALGLALGLPKEALGFNKLVVSPAALLEKWQASAKGGAGCA